MEKITDRSNVRTVHDHFPVYELALRHPDLAAAALLTNCDAPIASTRSQDISSQVDRIHLRAGPSKSKRMLQTLSGLSVPVEVKEADWPEDALREIELNSVLRKAISKTLSWQRNENGLRPGKETSGTVSIGSDVELWSGNVLFDKPLNASHLNDVRATLISELSGETPRAFNLRFATACCYHQQSNKTSGAVLLEEHRFVVDPIPPAAIQNYLDGISLQDAKSTTMGINWLSRSIDPYISQVEGISRDTDPQLFAQKKSELFRALMSLPDGIVRLIEETVSPQEGQTACCFTGLPGSWRQICRLDGETKWTSLTPIKSTSYDEISSLTARNFLYGATYENLPADQNAAYVTANSAQNIRKLCEDDRNSISLEARAPNGTLLGYVVTRKIDDATLNIQRIHAALSLEDPIALQRSLVQAVRQEAAFQGYSTVQVTSHGESSDFFSSLGFSFVRKDDSRRGVFELTTAPANHVILESSLSRRLVG